jgi:hypothetical protein
MKITWTEIVTVAMLRKTGNTWAKIDHAMGRGVTHGTWSFRITRSVVDALRMSMTERETKEGMNLKAKRHQAAVKANVTRKEAAQTAQRRR